MFRKTLSLALAGLITLGVATAGTQAATGPATHTQPIHSTNEIFYLAWGYSPAEADANARDLEARGYRRTSPILYGYVSSAGGNAYYITVTPF